jgi:hypothetical protein
MKAYFVSRKCITVLAVLVVSALAAIGGVQPALAHGTSASSSATSTVANTSNPPGIIPVPNSTGPSPELICPLTPVKAMMADGTSVPALEGPSPLATGCYYPTVVVSCNPTSIVVGGSSTCSWSITGADPGVPCFKSGGWTGDVSPNSSGSQTISFSTTGTTSFYVNCPDDPQAGVGGASVTVNPSSGGGGGGCTTGCGGTGSSPSGYLDWIDVNGVAAGWACDADSYSTPLTVEFHLDSPSGPNLGSMTASGSRPDVGGVCGTFTNHGYWFALPAWVKDGGVHSLYVLAKNVGGGGDYWLVHSGMQFVLAPPPAPAPTVNFTVNGSAAAWVWSNTPSATLGWNSTNATSCSISSSPSTGGSWSNLAKSGTVTASPPIGDYTYTVVCYGSGGKAAQSVTLSVVDSSQEDLSTGTTTSSTSLDFYSTSTKIKCISHYLERDGYNKITGQLKIRVWQDAHWCVNTKTNVLACGTQACPIYRTFGHSNPGFPWAWDSWDGSCAAGDCTDYKPLGATSADIWMTGHIHACLNVPVIGQVACTNKSITIRTIVHGDGTYTDQVLGP